MGKEKEIELDKVVEKNIKKDIDVSVDYSDEYRKQTGKDLETGEYVTQ